MSFGGGGSILAMIQSLRSNKNLLQGRRNRSFFLRELTPYQKGLLFKVNNKVEALIEKRPTKYIMKKEKPNWFSHLLLVITLAGICFCIHKINTIRFKSNNPVKLELYGANFKLETPYSDNMTLGRKRLIERDYFYAAGNFQKALKVKPTDIYAQYYSAKAFCKLCKYRNIGCAKAEILVNDLIEMYPRYNSPKKLKRKYLMKK